MKVRTWLLLLMLLFVVGLGVLFSVSMRMSTLLMQDVVLPQVEASLKEKYNYGLKGAVDVAAQDLAQRLKGVDDPKEQAAVTESFTDPQRFFPNDEGYLFTYKTDGVRINVPVNKSANGKNVIHLKDSDGVPFISKLIEAAKQGGGYVIYRFDKPGAGIQPKLAYTRMVPGTDIVIGTGVYIDSVETERARIEGLIRERQNGYSTWLAGIGAAILVLVLLIAVFVIRVINRPLQQISSEAQQVADGRLKQLSGIPAYSPREIGSLHNILDDMIRKLQDQLHQAAAKEQQVQQALEQASLAEGQAKEALVQAEKGKRDGMLAAAEQLEGMVNAISAAASRLSAQIEQSDKGALESSQRLSEAATAMNEMNVTVQEVARNASAAATVSSETRSNAEEGQKILHNAMASIGEVQKVSLALKEDMGALHDHTQNISQIMNVISDIADQTNLLALNAAIEAARAGEAGRGFAVVADEVRKLAEKTMSSTSDVARAITAIQGSAQQSVDRMEEAMVDVEKATSLAQQSGEALQQIVSNVEDTADQVRAIATASEEQSAASEEINQSITIVNEMSGQTTQAMNEAATAISELAQQTERLSVLIDEMKRAQ